LEILRMNPALQAGYHMTGLQPYNLGVGGFTRTPPSARRALTTRS